MSFMKIEESAVIDHSDGTAVREEMRMLTLIDLIVPELMLHHAAKC